MYFKAPSHRSVFTDAPQKPRQQAQAAAPLQTCTPPQPDPFPELSSWGAGCASRNLVTEEGSWVPVIHLSPHHQRRSVLCFHPHGQTGFPSPTHCNGTQTDVGRGEGRGEERKRKPSGMEAEADGLRGTAQPRQLRVLDQLQVS